MSVFFDQKMLLYFFLFDPTRAKNAVGQLVKEINSAWLSPSPQSFAPRSIIVDPTLTVSDLDVSLRLDTEVIGGGTFGDVTSFKTRRGHKIIQKELKGEKGKVGEKRLLEFHITQFVLVNGLSKRFFFSLSISIFWLLYFVVFCIVSLKNLDDLNKNYPILLLLTVSGNPFSNSMSVIIRNRKCMEQNVVKGR